MGNIKLHSPQHIFRVLGALALIATASITGITQTAQPKTVTDFLLLVPNRYMDGYDRELREELVRGERRGGVIDIANGYVSYDESDNPAGFEMAIFRKNNGKYIVAYSTGAFGDPELDRELGNWPVFYLLSYDRGKWRNVTNTLLPVAHNKKLYYHLPRQGKSIGVSNAQGRKLYTLTWQNDRFRMTRTGAIDRE